MKITQLFKIYWPDNGGGIARVMESIADGLTDCEQEIIVCQANRHKKSTDDTYRGVRVRRCSQLFDFASTPFSVRFLLDVRRRTKDCDVVIYHFPYPMIDLTVLFGLYSGRLVVWWHCDFEKYKKLVPLYRPLVEHTLKKADCILVSTEGNMDNSSVLCHYKEKCRVMPYCVSDEYLQRGKAYMQKPRRQTGQVTILFMGRLVWYKGCDVLLRAFGAMQYKNCRLILVGAGPLEQQLRRQAADMGLSDVAFTGMISEQEKMRYIEACDFLVLPSVSKAEAFALVQIEAMAFGKPVINTALPSGVPCVSVDGLTGITVRPNDADALARAMDTLAADETLRDRYGAAARARVEQEYTSAVMRARYEKLFGELVEGEDSV